MAVRREDRRGNLLPPKPKVPRTLSKLPRAGLVRHVRILQAIGEHSGSEP